MKHWLLLALALAAFGADPFFESFPIRVPLKPDRERTVYGQHPFSWNGLPAVIRAPDRLFLAWVAQRGFAGGGRLVGAYSNDGGRTWGEPIEMINNPDRDDGDPCLLVDGNKLVLISTSIRLPERFDKFNIFPVRYDRAWWWMTSTEDGGRTWSTPVELQIPHAYPGKRANGLRLPDGAWMIPYYYGIDAEKGVTPTLEGDIQAVAAMLFTMDQGRSWQKGQYMTVPGSKDASEPAVVQLSGGNLYCLLRNLADNLYAARSRDGGRTWSKPEPTSLSARNAPFALLRLNSAPGDEFVVVWNNAPGKRYPLSVSYSPDGGKTWTPPRRLANPNPTERFSADNPSIAETADGMIVAIWQEETLPRHLGKELRVARFNREWLRQ